MPKRSILLLSIYGLLSKELLLAQPIWFNGQVEDYQSHQYISATWRWTDSANHTLLERTEGPAGFEGYISAEARFLSLDRKGYRSVRLPIQWPAKLTDTVRLRAIIPLVSVDKMMTNRPYFQSEQQPLQLTNSAAMHKRVSVQFILRNVLTNEPVQADICLFFTKSGNYLCKTATALKTEVELQDIVAIETRAAGYQPYIGNIIFTDSIRNARSPYTIYLNPTPTIIMLTVPGDTGASRYQLKAISFRVVYSITRLDSTQLIAYVKPGRYQLLNLANKVQPVNDTILLREGLNGVVYPTTRPGPTPSTSLEQTIYFAQSSYELSPKAKQQLDHIITIMKQDLHCQLLIIGHTDNVGDKALNRSLSEFRARITKAYLYRQGIDEQRLYLDALGASQPITPNDTEENRRRNRRVSLHVR